MTRRRLRDTVLILIGLAIVVLLGPIVAVLILSASALVVSLAGRHDNDHWRM